MGEELGFGYFPQRKTPQQLATVPVGGWPPICDSQKILFSNYLTSLDSYGHIRSFECDPHDVLGSPLQYYKPWFGKPQFQKASIQGNLFEANNYSINMRKASAAAGTPWVIVFAEHHRPILKQETLTAGMFPLYRQSIWGSFLGGGAGVEWFIQPDDYYLKSFRPFRDVFLWTAYARDFMTLYIPFWEMKPANGLLPENSGYCFAIRNTCYALYLKEAKTGLLDLSEASGTYDVYWYDIRNGGELLSGTIQQIEGGAICKLGTPPFNKSSDWVVLVRNNEEKALGQTQRQTPLQTDISDQNTITDIDGNIYQTIKIGNQWWMTENLKVTRYRNGDTIPNVWDDFKWDQLSTGAYCAYDNNQKNADIYGYLYNWHAAHDSRKIAPDGWHVPTDQDWMELEISLGMSRSEANETGYRNAEVGRMLKDSENEYWKLEGSAGTNKSGFSAIPAGYRDEFSGKFNDIRANTGFWTFDQYDSSHAWGRYLKGQFPQLYRYCFFKDLGFSIRCVRD